MAEWIHIGELEVFTRIGVPDEERREPQRLLIDLRFRIEHSFKDLEDMIERTIDYGAMAQCVTLWASEHSIRLLETFVANLAEMLMTRFQITEIEVSAKKFVLPNAQYVCAQTSRKRGVAQ
jgi:7,8-dihydroneopterin aldolase/epimerase/oxygenase